MLEPGTKTGALTGLLSAIGAALGYLSGIDWDFSQINIEKVAAWMASVGAILGIVGKTAREAPVEASDAPNVDLSEPTFTRLKKPVQSQRNYFSDAELECKCMEANCQYPGMDAGIMAMANAGRQALGPLIVNSAFRCPEHNRAVGGTDDSYHLIARALDIRSPTRPARELYDWFDSHYPNTAGVILYNKFIHLDNRLDRFREDKTINTPDIKLA